MLDVFMLFIHSQPHQTVHRLSMASVARMRETASVGFLLNIESRKSRPTRNNNTQRTRQPKNVLALRDCVQENSSSLVWRDSVGATYVTTAVLHLLG